MSSAEDAAQRRNGRRFASRIVAALLFLSALVCLIVINSGAARAETPAQMGPTSESWVILPSMPPDASQADYGEQYYILVCRACHGDVGRGLTAEWIGQWAPADQNCWQSKCHSPNHPPDGFEIPRYVPPIMGEDALLRFSTAADLFEYIISTMPWQEPGSLLENEYWQITAFVLQANNVSLPEVLDAANAADVIVNPNAQPQQATAATSLSPTEQQTQAPSQMPTALAEPIEHPPVNSVSRWLPPVLGVLVAVPFLIWVIRRRRSDSLG